MPFKRLASKPKKARLRDDVPTPVYPNPRPHDQDPIAPPGFRRNLSPGDRAILLQCFPDTLDCMLDNENIRIGEIIDAALFYNKQANASNDGVDWAALELSSSDEEKTVPAATQDTFGDCHGIPLAPCYICTNLDTNTRLIQCSICCKRAHPSCLPWTAYQDAKWPARILWKCSDHPSLSRLTY